jgi:hypothetical protein
VWFFNHVVVTLIAAVAFENKKNSKKHWEDHTAGTTIPGQESADMDLVCFGGAYLSIV